MIYQNFFNPKLLFGEHLIEYIDLKLTATKIAVISEIYKLYAVVFFFSKYEKYISLKGKLRK